MQRRARLRCKEKGATVSLVKNSTDWDKLPMALFSKFCEKTTLSYQFGGRNGTSNFKSSYLKNLFSNMRSVSPWTVTEKSVVSLVFHSTRWLVYKLRIKYYVKVHNFWNYSLSSLLILRIFQKMLNYADILEFVRTFILRILILTLSKC